MGKKETNILEEMLLDCSVRIMMIVKQLPNTKPGNHKQKNPDNPVNPV